MKRNSHFICTQVVVQALRLFIWDTLFHLSLQSISKTHLMCLLLFKSPTMKSTYTGQNSSLKDLRAQSQWVLTISRISLLLVLIQKRLSSSQTLNTSNTCTLTLSRCKSMSISIKLKEFSDLTNLTTSENLRSPLFRLLLPSVTLSHTFLERERVCHV